MKKLALLAALVLFPTMSYSQGQQVPCMETSEVPTTLVNRGFSELSMGLVSTEALIRTWYKAEGGIMLVTITLARESNMTCLMMEVTNNTFSQETLRSLLRD